MASQSSSDRRHLLAPSIAPSECTSAATSIYNDGERTPRARSPARASLQLPQARHASIAVPEQAAKQQGSYRGSESQEAYIDALRAWADGRRYEQPSSTTLVGFYGTTTLQEYASREPAFKSPGLRKKWKAKRAAAKADGERKATVA